MTVPDMTGLDANLQDIVKQKPPWIATLSLIMGIIFALGFIGFAIFKPSVETLVSAGLCSFISFSHSWLFRR